MPISFQPLTSFANPPDFVYLLMTIRQKFRQQPFVNGNDRRERLADGSIKAAFMIHVLQIS